MIRCRQLTRRFGARVAIQDLDLDVGAGEVVGLLGPNGAGKTTTLRLIAGLLAPSGGTIEVAGHDVAEAPARVKARVGYLPEHPPVHTDQTVEAWLAYAAALREVRDPRAIDRAIDRTGLADARDRRLGELSKGYRQRAGLAAAILHEPAVLLLDEPASGLDPAQRVEMRSLLRDLADGDTTVLLSTHALAEVAAVCSRVVIIANARVVARRSLDDLARQGTVHLTVVRPDGLAAALTPLPGVTGVVSLGEGRFQVQATADVRAAVAHAAVPFDLLELHVRHALEDAYLQVLGEAP